MCLRLGLSYDGFISLKVSTILDIIVTSMNMNDNNNKKDDTRKATKDDNIMLFF